MDDGEFRINDDNKPKDPLEALIGSLKEQTDDAHSSIEFMSDCEVLIGMLHAFRGLNTICKDVSKLIGKDITEMREKAEETFARLNTELKKNDHDL